MNNYKLEVLPSGIFHIKTFGSKDIESGIYCKEEDVKNLQKEINNLNDIISMLQGR